MGSSPLDVSPLAALLLELAAQKATGRIPIAGRSVELVRGALVEIVGASQDETLAQLLHKTAGVAESVLAECDEAARAAGTTLSQLLARRGVASEIELRQMRRTLCVERLTRALRAASEDETPALVPAKASELTPALGLPLSPILLDALVRAQASSDAGTIGASLNHRIEWLRGPHVDAARDWADFGEGPEQPAISTVLAKRPAAASRIVALLRTGLIRLNPPGRTLASQTPPADTLPEPLPRFPLIEGSSGSLAPETYDPIAHLASTRPPRLRLDPGSAQTDGAPLEATVLSALPQASITIDDPLLPLEQRIAELEANGAPGPERARAFCALADVWRDRLFSTERACRAFREAAAADPSDSNVLQQAALHCHYLGQPELALRYAAGAVHAANIAVERASAQRLRAGIERVAGRIEGCIEALCEAAADDPGSPGLHEQVAALLFESGNLDGANAHARLAAAAIEDEQERQLTLLAWAFWLKPDDAASAYEYASLLDESGRRAGAVTILADTARRSSELDQRRKLRLAAAERASAAERPDIAAELLLDAFDADPESAELHVRLDTSLRALEFPQLRAAVVEDVATVCSDERRCHFLSRAGESMLDARDQREAANWLFLEALLTEPTAVEPLTQLRKNARSPRELALLAHGLRAAIAVRVDDAPDKRALLHELAELAEARLDNPDLAMFAWLELARMEREPTQQTAAAIARLNAQRELGANERREIEQALEEAAPVQRAELCAKLAVLVPDMPDRRARKIELLTEALAAGAASEPLCEALETLHGLNRDAAALSNFLEAQAARSADPKERARLLARLCAVYTVREDNEAVARIAESLLDLDPENLNAIARLLRAGRKLGDAKRQARALAAWAAAPATSMRARARALAQLAAQHELIGDTAEAARQAAAALAADAQASDAGLILLRHADQIEPRVAALGLQVLRDACGASRALLSKQAELAEAVGDRGLLTQVIERWLELLPHDAAAHRTRVLLRCDGLDASALVEAASSALSLMPCAATLDAARTAIDRLGRLGAQEDAARLGLRIAEEQGRRDFELARQVVGLAEDSGNEDLITAALELASAAAPPDEHAGSLLVLAAHHKERSAHAAEVRALLRVLEGSERHAEALARLRELFARGGEGPRLLAVVMLMLELEDDREQRRSLLRELAVISAERLSDRERAEHYVRMLVAENAGDEAAVREALGVLLTLGDAEWALARCQVIADACPDELGSRICTLCAITAEQRLEQPRLAIDIARKAALRWPSLTEPLLLLERLTLVEQDASTALATYDALCAVASGPHGRRALLYRAGRWLERAGLLPEALERYEHAFALSPTTGAAFKALSRVARETGRLDRIVPCYERLAEHLHEPRARVHLLSEASELCLGELKDNQRGLDLLLRANELSDRAEFDDRLLQCSRGMKEREPEAANRALERISTQLAERASHLWNGEDKVRCLMRLANVYSQDLGRHAQALAKIDEALAIAAREGLSDALASDARSERTAVLARVPPEPPAREPVREPTREPAEATRAPEVQAPRLSARTRATRDSRSREELRRIISAEPFRTDALRELCAAAQARPERYVLEQLVARFDRDQEGRVDVGFRALPAAGTELKNRLADKDGKQLEQALGLIWERARTIPRFRQLSQQRKLNERDRINSATDGSVADAYAHAARVLGRGSVPVYLVAETLTVEVVPSHPPAVLVGRKLNESPHVLAYRLAHALWLAQPEYVVAGVLAPTDANDLLRALRLAFLPDRTPTTASPADKDLAAKLWQNLASGEQRQLGATLREAGGAFDYVALRARSRSSAARAALLSSGALNAALDLLPALEPELRGIDLSREPDFARACQLSPALSETIRCALSPDYLTQLDRALAAPANGKR